MLSRLLRLPAGSFSPTLRPTAKKLAARGAATILETESYAVAVARLGGHHAQFGLGKSLLVHCAFAVAAVITKPPEKRPGDFVEKSDGDLNGQLRQHCLAAGRRRPASLQRLDLGAQRSLSSPAPVAPRRFRFPAGFVRLAS